MKFDWRDRRVILGAGVVALLMIGSYFLGRYQSSDAQRKLPSPVVNAPETPLDTPSTVIAPQPGSGSETVTEVMDAADTSESEQAIRESIVQLRIKQVKVEAEIDKIAHLRNETNRQWSRVHDRSLAEIRAEIAPKQEMIEKEIKRVANIVEENAILKFGPSPTFEEVKSVAESTEEWQQLGKFIRENDPHEAMSASEETYRQKIKEIEQKETELFDERSAIMVRIKDLTSQLAGE